MAPLRLLLVAILVLCVSSVEADEKVNFDGVTLRDSYGKNWQAGDLAGKKLTVVAFLGTECPLAKLYGPRLRDLAERFEDQGVVFVGVSPNVQDTLTEVNAYANRSGIKFPILMDPEQKLSDIFGATRTPEVFVIDADRTVQYRGRIDNQYAINVAREKPTENELADAMKAVLAGKSPSKAKTEPIGCLIGRKRVSEPTGSITYSRHIAPIFHKRCVECHRDGEIAPFSLSTYQDTIGWGAMMAEVIDEGRMPPWNANPKFGHFKNDARLSDDEKKTILTWIKNGSPEGDKANLPKVTEFVKGWRIPKPDLVINMRDKPFAVPATGVVDYKNFYIDPKFTEDVYVQAVEARPGNPEVVHHIVVYMIIPGVRRRGLDHMLIGYAPGTSPLIYPGDAGMRIPKGTKLRFELHYTPNGSKQTDLSYIGIKFVDKSKVKREVVGSQAVEPRFRIPPRNGNYVVKAGDRIREDMDLVTLTPHMHLRGKAFRYVLRYPNGKRETVLDVPKYDFNWQLRYELAKPIHMPRGSVLECTAAFDNSENNPNNPNPNKTVRWGDQSYEEMMIGFYTAVKPRQGSE